MTIAQDVRSLRVRCSCAHGALLHDRYGCGAFLGGFAETNEQPGYCACRRTRSGVIRRGDACPAAELPLRLPGG